MGIAALLITLPTTRNLATTLAHKTGHLLATFREKVENMKADRLVATLLLLQARQKVTCAQVAAELEISERTARRDLEALSAAGIPVYSQPGRNGGWALIGGARTDLSGLTANEARAMFMMAGPAAAATPELKAALRKLVRALPEPMRESAQTAASSIVIDPGGWGRSGRPFRPKHLDALQAAVAGAQQIRLGYADRTGKASTRVVHPLGLVVKGPVWYLVAGTDAGQRTFRVGRITAVEPTGEPAERPADFDLASAWEQISANVEEMRSPHHIDAIVDPTWSSSCAGCSTGSSLSSRPSQTSVRRSASRFVSAASTSIGSPRRSRASAPGSRSRGRPRRRRTSRGSARSSSRCTSSRTLWRRHVSRQQRKARESS